MKLKRNALTRNLNIIRNELCLDLFNEPFVVVHDGSSHRSYSLAAWLSGSAHKANLDKTHSEQDDLFVFGVFFASLDTMARIRVEEAIGEEAREAIEEINPALAHLTTSRTRSDSGERRAEESVTGQDCGCQAEKEGGKL